jgi:N-acetylneuraminate synthase
VSVFVIAEAGVNHNGSLELARKLVETAADAGADAVKFQTFRADKLITRAAPKAGYQLRTTDQAESQLEMVRKLELSAEAHHELRALCERRGIEFMSTPFDEDSVDMLAGELGIKRLKVPSGEIINAPLLLKMARTGLPVIVSTGMSGMAEIEQALGALAYGYAPGWRDAGEAAFREAYASAAGKAALRKNVVVLHCTTEYPAPLDEVNLRAMDSIAERFGLPVGYSDHTQGITIPVAAVARGAQVIEKHFTLDRAMPGPDHKASLEPAELAAMMRGIRDVERALGSAEKKPTASESRNMAVARKSLVAAREIAAGEAFSAANLAAKRAGGGISPMKFYDVLGRRAGRSYRADEALDATEFSS